MNADVLLKALHDVMQPRTEIEQFLAEPGLAYVTSLEIGTVEFGDRTITVEAVACSRKSDNPPTGPFGARLTISTSNGSTDRCFLDRTELSEFEKVFETVSSSLGPFGGMRVASKDRAELVYLTLAGLKVTVYSEPGERNRVSHTTLELNGIKLKAAGNEAVRKMQDLLSSAASHVKNSWAYQQLQA